MSEITYKYSEQAVSDLLAALEAYWGKGSAFSICRDGEEEFLDADRETCATELRIGGAVVYLPFSSSCVDGSIVMADGQEFCVEQYEGDEELLKEMTLTEDCSYGFLVHRRGDVLCLEPASYDEFGPGVTANAGILKQPMIQFIRQHLGPAA